jgi:hypothetical protein
MKRSFVVAALLGLVLPCSASASKYVGMGARIADDGDLEVHVEQRGVGKRAMTYTLSASGRLWWACDGVPWASVSWGGIGWSDPVTVTASSGRSVADLVFRRADGAYTPCAGLLARTWTRYDNILVRDSAGGSITLDPVELGVPF